jgi:N-acetylglucosamine-6-phosphate deacetylase
MATDSGVNEGTQAITAECIGDFIDANDITIYRQLAGGVTSIPSCRLGQSVAVNQVIKPGAAERVKFKRAPE